MLEEMAEEFIESSPEIANEPSAIYRALMSGARAGIANQGDLRRGGPKSDGKQEDQAASRVWREEPEVTTAHAGKGTQALADKVRNLKESGAEVSSVRKRTTATQTAYEIVSNDGRRFVIVEDAKPTRRRIAVLAPSRRSKSRRSLATRPRPRNCAARSKGSKRVSASSVDGSRHTKMVWVELEPGDSGTEAPKTIVPPPPKDL